MSHVTPHPPFRVRLHRAVWRWHFWAGLLISPVLIVAGLTGALWAFQPQLEPRFSPHLFFVSPAGARVPLEIRLEAVRAAYPGWTVRELYESACPDRATEFFIGQGNPERSRLVLVDPYTGSVRGHRDRDEDFFALVLKLHRTLFAGILGRILVELAASWGLVTLLTGLALWWPPAWKKAGGIWKLRRGPRARLRDLHAVPGLYALPAAGLLMATGLLFTPLWGRAWFVGLFAAGQLPTSYLNPPASSPPAGGHPPRLALDAALRQARTVYPFTEYSVHFPEKAADPVQFSAPLTRPLHGGAFVWLDAYDGRILDSLRFADLPPLARATLYFYPLHTGSILGWPTQALAVLASLAIVLMTITGVLLWWRRRPPGRFGAPAARPGERTPRLALAALLVCAALMPLMGLTLLLVALGEWLAGRFRASP